MENLFIAGGREIMRNCVVGTGGRVRWRELKSSVLAVGDLLVKMKFLEIVRFLVLELLSRYTDRRKNVLLVRVGGSPTP